MTDPDAVGRPEAEDPPDPETNGHAGSAGDEGDDQPAGTESIGIVAARSEALAAVDELLDHDLEGVVRVESTDDGWRTLVEVVERSAVPDTQDIIGRYEVLLDHGGTVAGYGLVERYRRGEMKEEL